VLPDWRPALTPTELKPAASVMSVRYRGVTHKITYTPGPDGLQHFLETLQSVGIKVASASQVTFLCRSPDTGKPSAATERSLSMPPNTLYALLQLFVVKVGLSKPSGMASPGSACTQLQVFLVCGMLWGCGPPPKTNTSTCPCPHLCSAGEEMALKGLKAFDAAAYCASITAAKRVLKEAKRKQQPPAPAHRHSQQQQQQQSDTMHQRDAGAPGPASEPSSPTAAGSAGAAAGGCERAVAHVHAEALHVVDAAHDDAAAAHEHPAQHALYAHDTGASSSHAWHQHHPAASAGGDAGGPASIPPAAGDSAGSAEHQVQPHGAEVAPSGRARRRSGSSSVRGWWQQLLSCVSRPALHAADRRL
jgi:hypothetical protein